MFSDRERIAHVVRRLGIGAHPDLVASLESVDDAIETMLALPDRPAEPPSIEAPADYDRIDYEALSADLLPWWLELIGSGEQGLVERLTWFWHDHFAVSGEKIDNSYVLWQHHGLVRELATGSFADLLSAVSSDAAMLQYLDGASNAVDAPNENFGREVMELFTVGPGVYTQNDVREISRAFTGWTVNEPHWERSGFVYRDAEPWTGVFDPEGFDGGAKTVLGRDGAYGMQDALDILLERPETGEKVAAALYRELVGLEPPPAMRQRLGRLFARDWSIMGLVEEIVWSPLFLADEAIRARVRTPLEKAATLLQAFPLAADASLESLVWVLAKLHYLPLHPPNVAGFPSGSALLDPARLFGAFELLGFVENPDEADTSVDIPARLGLYDLSEETLAMLQRFPRPGLQLGLAFGCPEFIAT